MIFKNKYYKKILKKAHKNNIINKIAFQIL